ncbi:hypothetical protein Vretimale_2062 [Volvox reticuliferus]|uniref:Uncharacterized protein n=1 Tax=Volvox reticuliferus TaxID=1737510 RepID=A0A8J4FGU8_9CHLO|nr:hypothetical protein Vretifemale_4407 [Volvox reticuliferus]GIL96284.1 hypothetical protein Vretimale_2062 [Volvox reticuliferus]
MLKASHSSCQRAQVAGRGSPKASTAGSPQPLLSFTPASSPFKWGLLVTPQSAPLTSVFGRVLASPVAAAVPTTTATTATNPKSTSANGTTKHHYHYANGNGHASGNGNGHGNGHSNGSRGGDAASGGDLEDAVLLRDAATTVRVHLVVPRCPTVPGEHLVLVGDCEALGAWDVRKGVQLHWCSGHMHTATVIVPADLQSMKAKLVMVHGKGVQANVTWEPGQDRSIALQPPATSASSSSSSSSSGGNGNGRSSKNGKVTTTRGTAAHDYVVICHWSHTEATSVLEREVPGEVLMLEQQLSKALSELRTARNAASTSQEKLQRMAQDLATSERAARQSADQLSELQAKYSAMTSELTQTKHSLTDAKRELTEVKRQATAAAAEAAAAKASSVGVAEVEARVSQRYEGRMAELKQQLDGVKSQYSSEVAALQQKLEASLNKEVEAQEMVKTLREIVQKDVARLRTELSQLVNEYIAARQQLQEQAQQIEASEKLRMHQIDGLSSEIKNLITKYNSAQHTIAEQQRLLEELQASRGGPLPSPRAADPVQHMTVPPAPDSQAGRGWRADWARLSKLTANGTPAATGNTR